jgi:hypothetical protein
MVGIAVGSVGIRTAVGGTTVGGTIVGGTAVGGTAVGGIFVGTRVLFSTDLGVTVGVFDLYGGIPVLVIIGNTADVAETVGVGERMGVEVEDG